MAAILNMTFSIAHYFYKNVCILIKISLKFVQRSPIVKTDSGNGLVPSRWQANNSTNFDHDIWHHMTLLDYNKLTLKHRETHGYLVSTVATDALMLKHQAISIHNAD